MVAMAKVVEVVTSPSAPRVNTFSGTNSPQKANRKNIPASGVKSRRSSPAPPTTISTVHSGADHNNGGDVEVEW